MAQPRAAFVLPPPPPDPARLGRVLIAAMAVLYVGMGVAYELPAAFAFAVVAGALTYVSYIGRQQAIGSALAMAALDRAARGRFDEARALLDGVSPKLLSSVVGQVVHAQRAALALYEGNLELAVTEATTAAREGKRMGVVARIHQGSALSIRAVALAGLGRKEESLSDVAKIRAAEYRQGSSLARAALAEAILHARDKDLEGLSKVLCDERALLFGATGPRERLVVRALARMVAAKKVSVYREAAKPEDEELDEQGSWVARIAPEAASYAKAPKLGLSLDAPEAIDPERAATAEKAAPKAKRPWKRILALWAILVVAFFAIWSFLDDQPLEQGVIPTTENGPEPSYSSLMTVAALTTWFVVFAGILGYKYMAAKRLTVELSRSIERRLRGLHDEARAAFQKLAKSKVALVASQAERELCTLATLAGDFKGAQVRAEAGIAATRSSAASLTLARPVLLPQLHGELALAFAAEGRVARADEEIEKLRTLFPSYPYLARDTFRTRLVALSATSRFDEAAEMARSRPVDMPLSREEELLCDALRVNAGDSLPTGERERIELEVRDEPEGAFFDRVAPSLRTGVHANANGRHRPRVVIPDDLAAPYSELPTSAEEADAEAILAKKIQLGLPT